MATRIHGTNTAAAPGITGDDTDSGLYYGTDQVSVSTAGTERFRVASAGQLGIGGATYGTDGHVLTSKGASAAPAWEAIPAGVGGATGVDFNDSVAARWGTHNDLQIYHNDTNAHLKNLKGDFYIQTNDGSGGTETGIAIKPNAAVELNYNNVKKFETKSGGADIHGTLGVKGIEGGAATINLWADEGDDGPDKWRLLASESANTFTISTMPDGGSWETSIECNGDGNVELYHNGTKQCETSADGLAFPAGKGISFAATTDNANGAYGGSMVDELLHDYEYGTWTPVLKFNGGVVGQSYSVQDGRYTKVGNQVTVQANINVTDKGTSTGNITMGGLPWLAKSSGAILMIQGDGFAYGGTQCWCLVGHNNANHYWNVQQGGSGTSANWVYLTHAAINDGNYYMAGSYIVAD